MCWKLDSKFAIIIQSMKYAVIKTGGKQYKVTEGAVVEVEKLTVEPNGTVSFDEVLLYVEDGEVKVGQPYVDGVTVKATVLDQIKGKKIRVAKFKAKARYRKVYGHRQELTKLQIESVALKGGEKKKVEAKEEVKAKKV